jgi:hypothetical protein
MQTLTVEASTLDVAEGLYDALADFHPEVVERVAGGYEVAVSLRGNDAEIVAILSALERHVSERGDGPARIGLEGRRYTLEGLLEDSSTASRKSAPLSGNDWSRATGAEGLEPPTYGFGDRRSTN